VARWARDHAVPVLLNAAPARPLSAAMTACIDILVVNRVEAAMMCGRTVSNRVEAREAVALLRAFARHIVITLGGEGLVVAEADGDAEDIAPERVEVVSTHGAGDCFVARLAAGLAAGEPLPLAARHANASAARYVAGELSLTAR
jgi:ribokinase